MEILNQISEFYAQNKELCGFAGVLVVVILILPCADVRGEFDTSNTNFPEIYEALKYRELKMSQMTDGEKLRELRKSAGITVENIENMANFPQTRNTLIMLNTKMSMQTQSEKYETLKDFYGRK